MMHGIFYANSDWAVVLCFIGFMFHLCTGAFSSMIINIAAMGERRQRSRKERMVGMVSKGVYIHRSAVFLIRAKDNRAITSLTSIVGSSLIYSFVHKIIENLGEYYLYIPIPRSEIDID